MDPNYAQGFRPFVQGVEPPSEAHARLTGNLAKGLVNKFLIEPGWELGGHLQNIAEGQGGFGDYLNAATGVAGAVPAGAAAKGLGIAGGLAGKISPAIFAGIMAKTADRTALATAERLAASGAPREQIWNETGWFKGADDKWRFEIPDNAASEVSRHIDIPHERARIGDVRVGDVFGHSDMYVAYPNIRDYRFSRDADHPMAAGSFRADMLNPDIKIVGVGMDRTPAQQKSTILHELQHGIQDQENFGRGGNLFGFHDNPEWNVWKSAQSHPVIEEYNKLRVSPEYRNEIKSMDEAWRLETQPRVMALDKKWIARNDQAGLDARQRALEQLIADHEASKVGKYPISERMNALAGQIYDLKLPSPHAEPPRILSGAEGYKRLAGEVEARNVQKRMDMTSEQRKAAPPWTTEDVPREQQIVRYK